MSFGFGTGGFGASSSPFGTTSPSPFGQQTPVFGQNTSPFGTATTTGVFGQSQPAFGATPAPAFGASPAPAFGATSAPAFGAASTPAFGAAPASTFGAKPAFGGFGASAASPFGASSTPSFGASAPAFGASSAPAFGASPFGTSPTFGASAPAFGATSAPAFGASSTPAFGQSLTAFGSTTFGAAAPTAGGFGAGGFGGGARGTRAVPWRKIQEQDASGSSGAKSVVYYNSISCMPEYALKSVEELRWEDYQDGCKGNTGAASPSGGGFGTTTFGPGASSPFGAPSSSPAFGAAASSPGFGASAPAFGAASAPAFGGFGATSAPAFGAAASAPAFGGFGASSASPFGATTASPFGQSAPAFGAASTPAFGASSSPAFGATSAPAFGAPSSAPAFGGFGATSAPAFGASPAPGFGASSTPGFGFGASSTPGFGAASAPAFGATSAPAFGFGSTPGFGATSAPAFGASSTSLFGASSTPAFGGTSLFGATQQKPATGFGFGAASTPAFGAAPTPAFGASGGSLFGASTTPAFGTGTNLFGAGQSAPSFSFAPAQPTAAPMGGAMAPAQPVQVPGVATSPYGVLPEPPKVSPAPEYKVGLTQRPAGLLAGGPPRPAALITPRSLTPRSGVRMRPRRSMSATRMSKSPADFLAAASAQHGGTPGADGRNGSTTPNGGIFVPRENPRRLFVRDPLPSTEAAGTTRASPAVGGTPGGRAALRTPGTGLRITPGRRADGDAGGSGNAENGGFALAENGNGFGGPCGGDVEPTDAQLSSLLPSLKQPDYYTEPSMQQLAAMAREDPASLAFVSNFVVGRRNVGHVRWLEPVDVRSLDLDAIVQLSKGSIEVYLDESTKPDVGRGLNKAAEVTMLRIHRLDKETGKPTTDPEAIDRFTRKLKKITAEQGARFVSYDPSSGTWRFEVEHFSKYGLLDSEDEEGSDEELATYGLRGKAASRQQPGAEQQQQQQVGEDGAADGEEQQAGEDGAAAMEEEGGEEAMQDSRGGGSSPAGAEDGGVDDERQQVTLAGVAREGADGGGGRVLAVSLPAQLGMEPEELQRIRDGLYAGSQQPPAKQRRIFASEGGKVAPEAPAGTAMASALAAPAPAARPALTARNAWRKQPALPLRAPAAARPGGAAAPRTPPQAGAPLLPAGPTPVTSAAASKQCPVPAPAPAPVQQGRERCLPDAGLFAGTSFRSGWAPNAVLAHAGGRASSAAHVVVRQLCVGARVAPPGQPAGGDSDFQKRQRRTLEAALELHIAHSSTDPEERQAAPAGSRDEEMAVEAGSGSVEGGQSVAVGVPRWRLRCKREGELRQLTLKYVELCTSAAIEAQGAEHAVLHHQATTWELLHVLFTAIEGEQQPGSGANGGAHSSGAGGSRAAAMDSDDDVHLDRLAAFKRRAQLSHWLRDRARPHVEAALRQGGGSGGPAAPTDAIAAQLLALLSGHQLAAAAALAAATGNVHLATLLAQAGTKVVSQAELADQLRVWEETGCERHISVALRRVYQLLAGRVDAVTPAMHLDWRRALGLHLWYGCQPTATVPDALASYTAAVEAGAAPPPLPLYVEQAAGQAAAGPGNGAFDVAFELLRLHAVVASDPDSAGNAAVLQPLLARLLRPAGFTPDPLNYSLSWHLLALLEALGVLPPAAAQLPQAAAVRMSFISQLECTGQLSHWAVYAALHIPEDAERSRVVRELLLAHADEWCDDDEALEFFRDRLRLPAAWLAEAQALWAQYCQDDTGRLDQLLAAGDWSAAHSFLCEVVAPRWMLAGNTDRLAAVLQQLELQAQAINLAGGPGAWEAGGGAYSAFLYLKDLYATLGRSSRAAEQVAPALTFTERMEAAARLSVMLQDAAVRWGLASAQQAGCGGGERRLDGRPGGGAAQQAVYARMSAELSKWVLSDSEVGALLPLPEQDALALKMRAMPQETAAETLQMTAIHLAQRVA